MPYAPTDFVGSPYSSCSAFAGNINYIDLEAIGRFIDIDLATLECLENRCVDYNKVRSVKDAVLRKAALNFLHRATEDEMKKFEKFRKTYSYWLLDF